MSENNKNEHNAHVSTSTALDDEQRVRVLSPGMLVAKRFFRNKLAVAGLIIIVVMFLFSFLGGVISPYSEREVFRTTETIKKDYAGATYVKDMQFTPADGSSFSGTAQAKAILAMNKGEDTFTDKDVNYTIIKVDDSFYEIVQLEEVVSAMTLKGQTTYTETQEGALTDALKAAYETALSGGEDSFMVDGVNYYIAPGKKMRSICTEQKGAIASKMVFSTTSSDNVLSFDFKSNALKALAKDEKSFESDGVTYTVEKKGENEASFLANGEEYAFASNLNINPLGNTKLSPEFKAAVQEAIDEKQTSFMFAEEGGEEEEYTIVRKNEEFTIRRQTVTTLNDTYAAPSKKHWLGTDGNGMDILTRLMYGGRISLTIGFITILIEITLGVLIGGIAGFFGGWIDSVLMRVVDIFYCIPTTPLYLILGSIMDYYRVDPKIRIYLLCVIIGFIGWVGTARLVRGQILSLREQEFMIAAEATGISVHRRIFKHLIPNVIPQLIVVATMGLGDVILLEASLSFLGLGVKYPFASWGNIINAVNDSYVMTNFWWVWIPAGLLILLTVLGFNFVGDGLRDAFDPKMKR